jgi:hypothetical protein
MASGFGDGELAVELDGFLSDIERPVVFLKFG